MLLPSLLLSVLTAKEPEGEEKRFVPPLMEIL